MRKDRYYWIGLKRTGSSIIGQGPFFWSYSGKKMTYATWWIDFMEPSRNGDCVIKDSWRQDDPRQYGWADWVCGNDNWNERGIYALCEIPNPRNPRIVTTTTTTTTTTTVVHGNWGSWQSWSQCSRTCGGGSQSASRSCNSPAPGPGGNQCTEANG